MKSRTFLFPCYSRFANGIARLLSRAQLGKLVILPIDQAAAQRYNIPTL